MNSTDIILSPEHGLCLVKLIENHVVTKLLNDIHPRLYHQRPDHVSLSSSWRSDYRIFLPSGYTYELIGTYPGLSEEQAAKVVEAYSQDFGWDIDGGSVPKIVLYRNYGIKKPIPVSMLFGTAIESFASLLESLNVFTESPHRLEHLVNWMDGIRDNSRDVDKWHTAEERTFRNMAVLKAFKN